MTSFIQLELDTTQPTIEVFAPNETTTLTDTTYRVEANETLANIQNFYFKDSSGVKHNVTLTYNGTYFEGLVSFDYFREGMATFYAQVYDEVLNKSSVIMHYVNVVETRTDHEVELDIESPREVITKIILRSKIDTDFLPYLVSAKIKPRNEIEFIEDGVAPYLISTTVSPRNKIEIDILNDD